MLQKNEGFLVMNEKTLRQINDRASVFLRAGETVRHTVPATEGPRIAIFFGLLGALMFTKQILVVATDERIVLMRAGRFTYKTPKGIEASHDMGGAEVTYSRSFPFNRLTVAGRTLWVGKIFGKDAEAVAGYSS